MPNKDKKTKKKTDNCIILSLKKKYLKLSIKRKRPILYNNWQDNVRFKDCHRGKRCFILGNGPSLKQIDLSLLSGEIVFSVNNFCKVNGCERAKPNYHLWMDEAFFNLRHDMQYDIDDTLENYKKISNIGPVCFVPLAAYDFINAHRLNTILNINYISMMGSVDTIAINSKNLDLTESLPGMTTVVQYAIMIAIYMGFKEIYLLGCDSTAIITTLNCALEEKNELMHAYDNDNTEKEIKGLLKNWRISKVFYDQYLLFLGYDKLGSYCLNNEIDLFNCCSKSLIDSVKYINFQDLFKAK